MNVQYRISATIFLHKWNLPALAHIGLLIGVLVGLCSIYPLQTL